VGAVAAGLLFMMRLLSCARQISAAALQAATLLPSFMAPSLVMTLLLCCAQQPFKPHDNCGTGWTFDHADGGAFRGAMHDALYTYRRASKHRSIDANLD